MKLSAKLQKKYDKVMKKIHKAGLEVKKGKVVGYKYVLELQLLAEYYTHYDGYMGEAIMDTEMDYITLSDDLQQEMESMEEITFNVIPQYDGGAYSDVGLKLSYKGVELGELYLGYQSEFTESWKEYKTLSFKKNKKGIWHLFNKELCFVDDQSEHVNGSFEIHKVKEYI